MKLWDFFNEVYEDYISEFDMLSMIEDMTDQYDSIKLNLICEEFDFYLFMKREEFLGSFSDEEIENKMHELERAGKKIPVMSDKVYKPYYLSDFFESEKNYLKKKDLTEEQKKEKRKKIKELFPDLEEQKKNTLDLMKMMNPHGVEFFSLIKLRNILIDLKRKHTDAVYKFDDIDINTQVIKVQPIHWLKNDKPLRQFIVSLKRAGLIENIETDEIIQKHFRQTDKTPQPIQWCKSNRLLIYLFNKLSEADLIDTMNRQFQLITEHFLDKNKQPFKRDSLKQDYQNMKYSSDPRGAKTIDTIIQELIA